MKSYYWTGLICLFLVFLTNCNSPAHAGSDLKKTDFIKNSELYVAVNGSDLNQGTKDMPFATFERARLAIRQLSQTNSLPKGGVMVYIRGGKYFRGKSFELTADDSGTIDKPIVYRAYPGEQVRIIGGKEIDPNLFSLVTDSSPLWGRIDDAAKGNLMQVNLTSHGITNYGQFNEKTVVGGKAPPLELSFDGEMMQLARWPNTGFASIASAPNDVHGQEFGYNENRPQRWGNAEDGWVFGYWYWNWWDDYLKITDINTATKVISIAPDSAYGIRAGQRWYAFNLLEEIDTAGEWYLDRNSGILYFWPPKDIKTAATLVSTLNSPIVSMEQTSYITLRDIIFELGRSGGVSVSGGNNNLISKCIIRNFASYGASISGTDNGIDSCHIHTVDYGVGLNGGDRKTLTPANLFAENNEIHDFGRWNKAYAPAVSIQGCGNKILHNLIYDGPHAAITYAGNDHLIEFNTIHHVVQQSTDSGAIYSGRNWTYQGNVFKHNFFHHIISTLSDDIHAIYFDDMLSGQTVFGNVFYKIVGSAVFNNGGRNNIFENNLFIKCNKANQASQRGVKWINCDPESVYNIRFLAGLKSYDYQNPPWSTAYPHLAEIPNDCNSPAFEEYKNPGGSKIIRNVSWRNKYFLYEGHDEGQKGVGALGYYTIEDNIEKQDPLFVDESNLNLALRDDSPAYTIPGFEKIPFEKIGILNQCDLDKNGDVDVDDFMQLFSQMSTDDCSAKNNWCQGADVDWSGNVDKHDLKLFIENLQDNEKTVHVEQQTKSVFIEDWNYSTKSQQLTSISPWRLGWGNDTCNVSNSSDTLIGNYFAQVNGQLTDSVYVLNTNCKLAGPVIRLEASLFLGGVNSHAYIGLGNYTDGWLGQPQAFNVRAKPFLFGIYDAEGTYTEDRNPNEYSKLKWWNIRLEIDTAANGGDGELDFYYKQSGETQWRKSSVLSDLNLQLKSNPDIDDPSTEWKGIFIRASRTEPGQNNEARIGHIKIGSLK